jgi:hypothetical protein
VVFASVEHEVVGALLLRRKWVEKTLTKGQNGKLRRDACFETFSVLNRVLGEWLAGQVEFTPHEADLQMDVAQSSQAYANWFNDPDIQRNFDLKELEHEMQSASRGEGLLDLLETVSPKQLERWMLTYTVVDRLKRLASHGEGQTRRRARAILTKWTAARRGRRTMPHQQHADVRIADKVQAAEDRLKEGWEYAQTNQADGARERRGTLLGMGYQSDEIDVMIAGRYRTVRGAAVSLVAQRSGSPSESISAQASRGKKLSKARRRR